MNISSLTVLLALVLLNIPFIRLSNFLSYSYFFWEILIWLDIKFYQLPFLYLLRWTNGSSPLSVHGWITLIEFQMWNQLSVHGINLTWPWSIILLIYPWIWFVIMLLRIFTTAHRILICNFLYLLVSLSDFGIMHYERS